MALVPDTQTHINNLDINPSMVIQSALALVMAITISDAIKTAVEHANNTNPQYAIHNRIIAMLLVIVIVLALATRFTKYKHANAVTPALPVSAAPSTVITP